MAWKTGKQMPAIDQQNIYTHSHTQTHIHAYINRQTGNVYNKSKSLNKVKMMVKYGYTSLSVVTAFNSSKF